MSIVEDHIHSIYIKLQELIKKYSSVKKENESLSCTINELKENEKKFREKIIVLETQNSILKASTGSMSSTEKNQFEKKINAFIKDVDACITMLNN